jgi:O-antigen/teichoic acid export membrane protein
MYVWVIIEFLFSLIGCIILNLKINNEYPWLKVNKSRGKSLLKQYPEIIAKTKQVFVHRIKDFVLVKSDELFIFLFVSLKMVAYYGNYIIIISKLISLFSAITGSVGASVGNLVAEGDKERMLKVFWELTTIQHTIAAILSFSLYCLLEPFVSHWLGPEYIMDHKILILLIIYIYITNSRNSIDNFNHSYGLYADVWSAWVELFINIFVTIVCGLQWGIAGILLGKITSLIPIVVIWKPYYLFTYGFKKSVLIYWKAVIRNYAISCFAFVTSLLTIQLIPINPYHSFSQWLLYSISCMAIFLTYDLAATIICAKGAKNSIYRIKYFRGL